MPPVGDVAFAEIAQVDSLLFTITPDSGLSLPATFFWLALVPGTIDTFFNGSSTSTSPVNHGIVNPDPRDPAFGQGVIPGALLMQPVGTTKWPQTFGFSQPNITQFGFSSDLKPIMWSVFLT